VTVLNRTVVCHPTPKNNHIAGQRPRTTQAPKRLRSREDKTYKRVKMLSQSQELIVKDITERVREELRDAGLRLTIPMQVENLDDTEVKTIEKVKMFMEENTEKTEKVTDVLRTSELHDKYLEWNENKNNEIYPEIESKHQRRLINWINETKEMGKLLSDLSYTKARGKYEGKTVRGYGYLKYKGEADTSISVLNFMEKYTERTKSSMDRIPITKVLPKFYREHSERYGIDKFTKMLNKYEYKTKAAKETKVVEGRYGKEKVVKCLEVVQCILKVKLKNEFYREEWTEGHEHECSYGNV